MTWPTMPPGLGTGHSRLFLCSDTYAWSSNSSVIPLSESESSVACRLLLRLLIGCPSGPSMVSANCFGLTGHGRMCGAPTTRKQIARVEVKRTPVWRERGWRAGGIFGRRVRDCGCKTTRAEKREVSRPALVDVHICGEPPATLPKREDRRGGPSLCELDDLALAAAQSCAGSSTSRGCDTSF